MYLGILYPLALWSLDLRQPEIRYALMRICIDMPFDLARRKALGSASLARASRAPSPTVTLLIGSGRPVRTGKTGCGATSVTATSLPTC